MNNQRNSLASFKIRLFQPIDETERQWQNEKNNNKTRNQNNIRSIACVALKTDNWISSYVKSQIFTPCHRRWVAYVPTENLCGSNETNLSTNKRDMNITLKIGRILRVQPILFNCIGERELLANAIHSLFICSIVCVSFWILLWTHAEHMQTNVTHTWIVFVEYASLWFCCCCSLAMWRGPQMIHSKTWHSTMFHACICVTSHIVCRSMGADRFMHCKQAKTKTTYERYMYAVCVEWVSNTAFCKHMRFGIQTRPSLLRMLRLMKWNEKKKRRNNHEEDFFFACLQLFGNFEHSLRWNQ